MAAPILEVVDVHKRYGSTVALDKVSFRVEEAEIFGLLGPNGAGKTTLLSIITCLLAATAGSVRIAGQTVRPADKDLRRLIGLVPQELAVYPQLTARENLTFFGALYGLSGASLRQRVDEILAAIALEDRADQRVDTFSGGMQRRLNLGAALVHGPRLLLLDEPTTGVDPQSRNHIFEGIRRLNRSGVTVVYTSHYMEEVQALCPRIGIIDHGRLIACDSLPALLQQLEGGIRFQALQACPSLHARLRALPDVHLRETSDGFLEMQVRDVKASLLRVLEVLNDLQVGLGSLETEEPNLERVFLHLTGRELRD